MAFKTAAELVVFSTGTFIDNVNGDISPLDFRNMHQHVADSLIPYDASGVHGVKVLPTGNVPTTTPTGYLVYDNGLKVFTGVQWSGVGGGGGGTSYTAGTGLQLAGTVFNALTASTSVTGVTILTNTIDASQNKALTPKAVNDAGYISAHPTISNAASNSDNSGRTYVQDLLFDGNGHVTGVTTAAETVTDTTYTAGTGLSLNGTELYTAGDADFNSVTVATGVVLTSATPAVTTNKLYNIGGTLYFNGSGVAGAAGGGGGGGYDWIFGDGNGNTETIASGETVYASGTGSVTATYSTSTNILTINGTDTTYTAGSGLELASTTFNAIPYAAGSGLELDGQTFNATAGTSYTAGTGLALNGSEFSTAQTGHFDAVVVSDSGNIGGVFTTNKAVKTAIKSNTDGATITFDLNESNTHYATLGGNRTIALSNPSVGQKFILRLQQDGTGSRTVTWFSTIKWDGVTPPTLSTSGNRADLFGFLCTSGNQYDGMVLAQNLG
jgi:hypothetical protein